MKATFASFGRVTILGLFILAVGCGSSDEKSADGQPCQISADCPTGQFCEPDENGQRVCRSEELAPTPASAQGMAGRPAGANPSEPSTGGRAQTTVADIPTIGSFAGEMGNTPAANPSSGGTDGNDGQPVDMNMGGGTPDPGMNMMGSGPECPEIRRALKPNAGSIPRVMLVVDRSWSMLQDEDRWTPIEMALNQVTQALDNQVKFGLVIFPNPTPVGERDPDMFGACLTSGRPQLECEESYQACAPGVVAVEPELNTSAAIVQQLQEKRPAPNQGTPTASALDAARQKLLENPGPNDFVILATDGGPGCNFAMNAEQCVCMSPSCSVWGNAEMCLDDVETINAVTALAMNGIRTLVLGISIGLPEENACIANRCFTDGQVCINDRCVNQAPKVLDAMAVAGQTDVNGRHYAVEDLAQIQQRLTAVAGSIAPCTYGLDQLAEFSDRLRVAIDDVEILRDPTHTNGWDVVNGLLELYGEACEQLRDGAPHTLSATCY